MPASATSSCSAWKFCPLLIQHGAALQCGDGLRITFGRTEAGRIDLGSTATRCRSLIRRRPDPPRKGGGCWHYALQRCPAVISVNGHGQSSDRRTWACRSLAISSPAGSHLMSLAEALVRRRWSPACSPGAQRAEDLGGGGGAPVDQHGHHPRRRRHYRHSRRR